MHAMTLQLETALRDCMTALRDLQAGYQERELHRPLNEIITAGAAALGESHRDWLIERCPHGRPFGDGLRPDDCPDCDEHHGAELAEQSIGKEPGGA